MKIMLLGPERAGKSTLAQALLPLAGNAPLRASRGSRLTMLASASSSPSLRASSPLPEPDTYTRSGSPVTRGGSFDSGN